MSIVLAGTTVFIIVGLLIYFAFLNEGRLETVDFTWVDYHPTSDLSYVHLDGTVLNTGSSSARQVRLVARIYDSEGTLLRTEITDLGDIPVGACKKISVDIQYAGKANKCEVDLRWKPFGG
jgi:hypothetical protein